MAAISRTCGSPMEATRYARQRARLDPSRAQFDGGKKVKNAVITVRHNGLVVHDKVEIAGPTGGGKPETAEGGEIQLQGHGNPVFYRNIWIVEK